MWNENTGWKWDEFANYLPQEELQKIAAYSLSPEPDIEDTLYWNGTSHGKFSIKSALILLKGDSENIVESNPFAWHVIWKLPVQQRIRMFIWLAAHERLMTNYNRVRRGLADDPICPRCMAEDETVDHLLRQCPISGEIWSQLGLPASSTTFFTKPFHSWISMNASSASKFATDNWSMEFAITCGWLCCWRNNVVFGRSDENPTYPIRFLRQQFETSKRAFDPFSLFIPSPKSVRVERYIRWNPPPHRWILLNTDGASRGNPDPAGCGGLFRTDTGNFLSAFSFSCGICTSMRAELRALVVGLEQARSLGLSKVLVCMDNSLCVDFFREDQLLSNNIRPLVQRCKDLIALDGWIVQVEHIYREANRAADWSTMACNQALLLLCLTSLLRVFGISFGRIYLEWLFLV